MDKDKEMEGMEIETRLVIRDLKQMREKMEKMVIGLSEFEGSICVLLDSLYNFKIKCLMMKGGKRDE